MFGLKTLTILLRWMRSEFLDHALILGYHRVAEVEQDSFSLCVSPGHFEEHLNVLHKQTQPLRLEELVQKIEHGNLPPRAVVITFDDGYADIFYQAKPLMEGYQIPATVFMATGYMGNTFWWDELEQIIMAPQTLPERLCLSSGGLKFDFHLTGAATELSGSDGFRRRKHLLRQIYEELLPLSFRERRKAILDLENWAGIEPLDSPDRRALNSDELAGLVDGGLIDVGSHTTTHAQLTNLSDTEQRSEVVQSKLLLEDILGRKVTSFAYPHGLPSQESMTIVRDAGFLCACSSYNDVVRRKSDPFHLPRFWIPDWDGGQFSRWLMRWIDS